MNVYLIFCFGEGGKKFSVSFRDIRFAKHLNIALEKNIRKETGHVPFEVAFKLNTKVHYFFDKFFRVLRK